MAFSQADICNLALSRAGGHSISQITSLGEASTEARQCAVKFPHVLRSALRAYPWRFAVKEIALALLGTGAELALGGGKIKDNIRYQSLFYYQYPEECLQILAVSPVNGKKGNYGAESAEYTVERLGDGTKVIVTPCAQAVLTCSSYADDPSIWDSLFLDAFAWQLAGELALSFGADYSKVQALQNTAQATAARHSVCPICAAVSFREQMVIWAVISRLACRTLRGMLTHLFQTRESFRERYFLIIQENPRF